MATAQESRRMRIRAVGSLAVVGLTTIAAAFFLPITLRDREGVPRITGETDAIHVALDSYEREYGTYPAGDSRQIGRALVGENPRKIRFIGLEVSTEGDLLDPWGTPYEVYLSNGRPLIRSAGPNREFEPSGGKGADDSVSE